MISLENDTYGWVLDFGASFYMTPCIDYLYMYHHCSGGTVFSDNKICKTVVKSVRIAHVRGISACSRFDPYIKDVWHVSVLWKSLLSWGESEANGCKFSREKHRLRITKITLDYSHRRIAGNPLSVDWRDRDPNSMVANVVLSQLPGIGIQVTWVGKE